MEKHLKQDIEEAVEKIKKIDEKGRVQSIILYGSAAEDRESKLSDIDLVIEYDGNEKERFNFRVKALGELSDKFDVQIFQDLPLYVRKEVLKGKVLHTVNTKKLNEIALETIREFEFFEPRFLDYISKNLRKSQSNIPELPNLDGG